MKTSLVTLLATGLAAVSVLLAGCGGGTAKTKMDTKEFTEAFASADASLQGPATEAAKALNSGKLFEGATALVGLAKSGSGKLSETQKNALINLGATVQMVMAEDGDKADLKVHQAIEDLMAALEERDSSTVGITPDRVAPATAK
jgi:hypothetical protein